MNVIKRILQKFQFGIALVLVAPLILIAIPFAASAALADIPMKRRRQIKLKEIVQRNWLPSKKYVYLVYKKESVLAPFIEEDLLKKYGKHIIADRWSDLEKKWVMGWPDEEKRVGSILSDIIGDHDGDFDVVLVTVEPATATLNKTDVMSFRNQGDKGLICLEDQKEYSIKLASDMVESKVSKTDAAFS